MVTVRTFIPGACHGNMNASVITFLKHILTIGTVLLFIPAFGQDKILSGMVIDGSTGDPIPSVSIQFTGAVTGGALSNQDGKFAIRYLLPKDGQGLPLTYSLERGP